MKRGLVLLLVIQLSVLGSQGWEILFIEEYEEWDLDVVEAEYDQRNCMSVEFPRPDYQEIALEDYLLVHCTCFGGGLAPACPRWEIVSGEDNIRIEENRVNFLMEACETTLLIGKPSNLDVTHRNFSLRCVIPHSTWALPEVVFQISTPKFSFSYVLRHHSVAVYGFLFLTSIFLFIVIYKRKSKSVCLYTLSDDAALNTSSVSGTTLFEDPRKLYKVCIKIAEPEKSIAGGKQ